MITGNCLRCGRITQMNKELFHKNDNELSCPTCFTKYCSTEIIRDEKIKILLKKPWYRHILNR